MRPEAVKYIKIASLAALASLDREFSPSKKLAKLQANEALLRRRLLYLLLERIQNRQMAGVVEDFQDETVFEA